MTAPVLTKAPNPGTSNNSNTVALPAAFSVPNGAALVLQVNAYQYLGFNPVSTVSIGAYTATLIVKNDPDTVTQGGANLTSFYYWKNTTGSAQSITPSVTFSGVNAHNAIWAEYWTGFDTTTFFDAVTSANALESAYPSPIDTITLPTRGDDVLRIGTSFTYGSTATSSNAGQVDIGEEAGGGAYSAAAYKVAVTNSTTAGFTKDVSYGAATVGFVLRTAAPVTIALGSVTVEIVGGATSVGVDQTVQVRWRALSTTSQPFTGATITPSGYNSAIASANPSAATGLSDTNGYYTVTMTGVSPGSLTFAGSATYSGTTVNVGASASLAVNGGIGGVSIIAAPSAVAPVITSPSTFSVAENTAFSTQLTATDANGGTLTWSISGGADAAIFNCSSTGILTMPAQNYETPLDADGNNAYLIIVAVTDGTFIVTQSLTVNVTNIADNPSAISILSGSTHTGFVRSTFSVQALATDLGAPVSGKTLSISPSDQSLVTVDSLAVTDASGIATWICTVPGTATPGSTCTMRVAYSSTVYADLTLTIGASPYGDIFFRGEWWPRDHPANA